MVWRISKLLGLIADITTTNRVAGGCCQPQAPSEPYVTISRHTAQAFVKACPCGAARLFRTTQTITPDKRVDHRSC